MITNQELYRQLRSLGFSAEQALAEMHGESDDTYESAMVHRAAKAVRSNPMVEPAANNRKVVVTVPSKRRARGPMFEYFAKPIGKRKITVAMGNNTDVYKALSKTNRKGEALALSVPAIAEVTGIPAHSVESSVYQLRVAGLVDKRPIER